MIDVPHSPLGSIAYQYRTEIPTHFPFVELDVFVIMPDHVHGIVSIQPRFHDRVIRDHNEYTAISDYINNNIEKRESDDLYKTM
jgi:hypothetical protein